MSRPAVQGDGVRTKATTTDANLWLGRINRAEIYDGERLEAGMTFVGPAVVEDPWSTVVVHPGNEITVDGYRNIHIRLQV